MRKQKKTTEIYDPLVPANMLSTVESYSYANSNHKLVTSILTTDSRGKQYTTVFNRSSDIINVGTSPDNFNTKLTAQHRLSDVIEKQTWLNGETSSTLLGSEFTEYKDYATQNGNTNSQLLPFKKYVLEANPLLTNANFVSSSFPANNVLTLDPHYRALGEMNYDSKDNVIKQSIYNAGLKNNSTTIYGHSQTLPIAQVNNATEADCGFTSFESDDQNLWTIGGTVALITTDGHTGISSRSIPANTFGPTRNYMPSADAQNKKFILSCWVKTNSNLAGAVGSLVLTSVANINSTTTFPSGITGSYISSAINNTNNVWKYVEVEIDLKLIKFNGNILNTTLALRSYVSNTHASIAIQVDDIRFYPKEARMASYTYSPLIGATSVSDENSNCQYYEYDSFGRLRIVKDQNGKILERTEYNYKP